MSAKAIVTGGTTGIGFGIATAMVNAGYDVTVTGLTDEQVGAIPQGQRLSAVKLDVTCAASVAAVLEPFDKLGGADQLRRGNLSQWRGIRHRDISKSDRREPDRNHAYVRWRPSEACGRAWGHRQYCFYALVFRRPLDSCVHRLERVEWHSSPRPWRLPGRPKASGLPSTNPDG